MRLNVNIPAMTLRITDARNKPRCIVMKEINERIVSFFDRMSQGRDDVLDEDPILNYEQLCRQESVLRLLEVSQSGLLLDIGCGNARDLVRLSDYAERLVGIDISRGMLKEGRKKLAAQCMADSVDLVLADATQLPFRDGVFSKCVCSEVIEHIPNYPRAIAESRRVLTSGGSIVISTPNWLSAYGAWRFILEKTIMHSSKSAHPFDAWNTKTKLVSSVEEAGYSLRATRGACYIPSHLVYYLPRFLKRMLVKLIGRVEDPLAKSVDWAGYMIVLSAIKPPSERS